MSKQQQGGVLVAPATNYTHQENNYSNSYYYVYGLEQAARNVFTGAVETTIEVIDGVNEVIDGVKNWLSGFLPDNVEDGSDGVENVHHQKDSSSLNSLELSEVLKDAYNDSESNQLSQDVLYYEYNPYNYTVKENNKHTHDNSYVYKYDEVMNTYLPGHHNQSSSTTFFDQDDKKEEDKDVVEITYNEGPMWKADDEKYDDDYDHNISASSHHSQNSSTILVSYYDQTEGGVETNHTMWRAEVVDNIPASSHNQHPSTTSLVGEKEKDDEVMPNDDLDEENDIEIAAEEEMLPLLQDYNADEDKLNVAEIAKIIADDQSSKMMHPDNPIKYIANVMKNYLDSSNHLVEKEYDPAIKDFVGLVEQPSQEEGTNYYVE